MSTTTLLRLPDLQGQSFDVYFRYDEFGADTHSPPHTHAWGQLNYAAHGVMQLEIDGQRQADQQHGEQGEEPEHWLRLLDAFYRAGSLVFGGGHVVLPLLKAEVVPKGWV
ncbi:chromate transporter, partial [Pseudomonas aeruginosa]